MLWGSEAIVTSAPSGVKKDPSPHRARDKAPRSRRHLPRRHAAARPRSDLPAAAPVSRAQPQTSNFSTVVCALGQGLLREIPPPPGLTS